MQDWSDVETPKDGAEEWALIDVLTTPEAEILRDMRIVAHNNYPCYETGDQTVDLIMADNKGYVCAEAVGSRKFSKDYKARLPFQPTLPEFQDLYNKGFRLCHKSFRFDNHPVVVVHYWANMQTGVVARTKIKRNK